VVDNGSTDNSAEIAKRYADYVLYEGRRGITFAKNAGIRAAKGEFIVTTDADCIPDNAWIEELVKCFTDPGIASAGGANLVSQDASPFEKCVDFLLHVLSNPFGSRYISRAQSVTETFHNPGCNVAYRGSVVTELGGFNERLLTVEDEEFDFRIKEKGYRLLSTPFAKVYHTRKSNGRDFARQFYRYAVGRMQFIKIHPRMAQWPRFIPSVILLFGLVFLTLGIFNSIFLWIFFVGVVAGLTALLLFAYYLAVKSKEGSMFAYLFLLLLASVAWGLGFMRGIWYQERNK
jgi:GT2 family glycosyltransferase